MSERASRWPVLEPEARYPGEILLSHGDSIPLFGSLGGEGGAAVWLLDTEDVLTCFVSKAMSSTECKLVALCMALAEGPRKF
jgi:hypothetical protein